MKIRKLDPETNLDNFREMRKMGIDAGKIMRSADEDNKMSTFTLQHKKEVLRYVLYCAHHIDLFQRLFKHVDFGKRSNHKLEMCIICLLHLEMRIGENLLGSLFQELFARVLLLLCVYNDQSCSTTFLLLLYCVLVWGSSCKGDDC